MEKQGYLQLINTQTSGGRNDVTPIFKDSAAFKELVSDLQKALNGIEFDHVAGIDALGFILGTALAVKTEKGFVPIRKTGKLPVKGNSINFVDYTGTNKGLELAQGVFKKNDKVLLIDDWIETGTQVKAAVQLIEEQGAQIAAVGALGIEQNERTRPIFEKYRVISLISNERPKAK